MIKTMPDFVFPKNTSCDLYDFLYSIFEDIINNENEIVLLKNKRHLTAKESELIQMVNDENKLHRSNIEKLIRINKKYNMET